jgi:hypothetical protein
MAILLKSYLGSIAGVTPIASYAATVDGLVGGAPLAHWRLGEASGTQMTDRKAGARHGTYSGTIGYGAAGLPQNSDGAVNFSGTGTGSVPHDVGLELSAFSLSFWFKLNAEPPPDVLHVLLAKAADGNNAGDLFIYVDDFLDLHIVFENGVSGPNPRVETSEPLEVGTAYHLVVRADSTGFDAYLNGQYLGKNTTFTGAWAVNANALTLATTHFATESADCVLDEVALYDRALTEAEVIELSQRTAAPITVNDTFAVPESATTPIDVVANDTFVGQKANLTVDVLSQPSFGTATVRGDNDLDFVADAVSQDEADSFTYRVTDPNGQSNTATVNLTVLDAAEDYAGVVDGLAGGAPLAHWRLGEASGQLTDRKVGARHATVTGTVNYGAAALPQDSDNAVDFAGSGYAEVPHDAGLALPTFTLSFWFKMNSLPTDTANWQPLIGKDGAGGAGGDGDFTVHINETGSLRVRYDLTGGAGQQIVTGVNTIAVGVKHHVAVRVDNTGVDIYLDGLLISKNTDWLTGWTNNTQPLQFANTGWANVTGDCVLDEIALYGRVLTEGEVRELAQFTGNALCFVESGADTVEVSSMAALASAVNAAPAGRNILIAPGTYIGGSLTLDGRGAEDNPVVVRPRDGLGTVTINSNAWTIPTTSHDLVIEKLFFDGGQVKLNGTRQRISRGRFRNFGHGAIYVQVCRDSRIDHCDFAEWVPVDDTERSCVRLDPNTFHTGATGNLLFDYNYIHDINPVIGRGGQEMIKFFGVFDNQNLPARSICVVDHCLFENIHMPSGGEDELVSVKSSGWAWEFCTFINTNMRLSQRNGNNMIVRSCWFEDMRPVSSLDVMGRGALIIGNRFEGGNADTRCPAAGNATMDDKLSGTAPLNSYGSCEDARIIGNVLTNGAVMQVGRTVPGPPHVPASNNNLWDNTGTVDTTTWSDTHTGTTFNEDNEPYVPAVKLTAADVGLNAPDPLCG